MNLTERLHKCNSGEHELVEILRTGDAKEVEEVARWCRVCGAVVVDYEHDYRLTGTSVKMMGPEVLRNVQLYYE